MREHSADTTYPTQLFVDMDGVLADFDAGYGHSFGVRPSKADDNVDWELVRRTEGFYRNLPPMPDFDELWSGIAHLSPIILTGVPSAVVEAAENKREWICKHIGPDQPMIACRSKDKRLHMCNPGDILLDDWEKYRSFWETHGGRWITHITASQSLQALSKIGSMTGGAPRVEAPDDQSRVVSKRAS